MSKKIYFLSDFHLGVPDHVTSLVREKRVVEFLEMARKDAEEIMILGDIFDFWFEYKHAVPRGFVRLLGKIAEITDSGIPIHVFTGNHDMWIFDYLPKETGVILHRVPIVCEFNSMQFMIGHGDGLGPGDHGYKFIKKVFRSSLCQWLFARLHPNFGIGLANFWSGRSRKKSYENDREFLGEEKEFLILYCKDVLQQQHYDHFIFGHRHLPLQIEVGTNSTYTNLGDWITYFTYAVLEGKELKLKERGKGTLENDKEFSKELGA